MILVYHHVAPQREIPPQESQQPIEGWQFTVSPEAFRGELQSLRAHGYRFTTLDELVTRIKKGGAESARDLVVTFDDGWVDNHKHALPILRELGIPATFFIATDYLANGTNEPRKMTQAQLKDLVVAGMALGGHTRSHPDLTRISKEQAYAEIAGCRNDLGKIPGAEVRHFAYPGGAFNNDVARMVKEAGYESACSVIGGGRNNAQSLFWMYRTVLGEPFGCLRNRIFMSRVLTPLLDMRAARRARQFVG